MRVVFWRYASNPSEVLADVEMEHLPAVGDQVSLAGPDNRIRRLYVTEVSWVLPTSGEAFCQIQLRDPNKIVG